MKSTIFDNHFFAYEEVNFGINDIFVYHHTLHSHTFSYSNINIIINIIQY